MNNLNFDLDLQLSEYLFNNYQIAWVKLLVIFNYQQSAAWLYVLRKYRYILSTSELNYIIGYEYQDNGEVFITHNRNSALHDGYLLAATNTTTYGYNLRQIVKDNNLEFFLREFFNSQNIAINYIIKDITLSQFRYIFNNYIIIIPSDMKMSDNYIVNLLTMAFYNYRYDIFKYLVHKLFYDDKFDKQIIYLNPMYIIPIDKNFLIQVKMIFYLDKLGYDQSLIMDRLLSLIKIENPKNLAKLLRLGLNINYNNGIILKNAIDNFNKKLVKYLHKNKADTKYLNPTQLQIYTMLLK